MCDVPFTLKPEATSGCPSTRPSAASTRNNPNRVEVTVAGVRIVSVRFWAERELSLWYVSTSVVLAAAMTVSVAATLVIDPMELVIVTLKIAPLSSEEVAAVV